MFKNFFRFILPYKEYEFKTEKSPEQVVEAMQSATNGGFGIPSFGSDNQFYGKVSSDGFKVTSNLNYNHPNLHVRNSFAPVILGNFSPNAKGTIVRIKMRMHILVNILVGFILSVLFLAFLSGILMLFVTKISQALTMMTFCALLFGATELLIQLSFRIPASGAQKRLEALLY